MAARHSDEFRREGFCALLGSPGMIITDIWPSPEPPGCQTPFSERGGIGSTRGGSCFGLGQSNIWLVRKIRKKVCPQTATGPVGIPKAANSSLS